MYYEYLPFGNKNLKQSQKITLHNILKMSFPYYTDI